MNWFTNEYAEAVRAGIPIVQSAPVLLKLLVIGIVLATIVLAAAWFKGRK